jgi:hypothetical protein
VGQMTLRMVRGRVLTRISAVMGGRSRIRRELGIMNVRLLPATIIGAVLALAIGYSVHKLSGGGLILDWVRLDADDVVADWRHHRRRRGNVSERESFVVMLMSSRSPRRIRCGGRCKHE